MQEYFWKPGSDIGGVYEYTVAMGYQLNVQLRPGEKITRNFFSRGIDYTNNMEQGDYNVLQDRKLLGIQTKLGDRAPGRVGDGTFEWNVPLKPDTLKTVALTADNLSAAPSGVTLADAGKPAILVLRFPSSYVYVKGEAAVSAQRGPGRIDHGILQRQQRLGLETRCQNRQGRRREARSDRPDQAPL